MPSTPVLLADDDEAQHAILGTLFPAVGLDLLHARTPAELTALVAEHRPAVVILGARPGGRFTLKMLDELRRLGIDPARSVLLVTTHTGLREESPTVSASVAGYLTKPCEPRALVQAVRGLIAAGAD